MSYRLINDLTGEPIEPGHHFKLYQPGRDSDECSEVNVQTYAELDIVMRRHFDHDKSAPPVVIQKWYTVESTDLIKDRLQSR